jgi:NAD-dependent deacetylase
MIKQMENSNRFKNLVILTGAGISAESGLATFRAEDGLWHEHRIDDVATFDGFASNPDLVHNFYNQRRAQLRDPKIQPNAAHLALSWLESEWEGDFLLITQNVDDLHERAGSQSCLHMHGSLLKVRCLMCEFKTHWDKDLSTSTPCPKCSRSTFLRPDVVWFGEMPYYLDAIAEKLRSAQIFISIGTSGEVYPAANFAVDAWKAHRIEVNTTDTAISSRFHEHRKGLSSLEVPRLVKELLA